MSKLRFRSATALSGALAFLVSAQPAHAECVENPESNSISCEGTTTAPLIAGDGLAHIANSGTMTISDIDAIRAGNDIGAFNNSGTISVSGDWGLYGVVIGGLTPPAEESDPNFVNSGTIFHNAAGGSAVFVSGPVSLLNEGNISSASAVGIFAGPGSRIVNASGAVIGGSAAAIIAGADSNLINNGLIENEIQMGAGSRIENHGTIGGTEGIVIVEDGTIINDGSIASNSVHAVTLAAGSNLLANSGSIRMEDAETGDEIILLGSDVGSTSGFINADGGVVGRDSDPAGVVAITAGADPHGATDIVNSGEIHGDIVLTGSEQRQRILNGYRDDGTVAAAALIDGNIQLGAGDDEVRNAGTIVGSVSLGDGVNLLVNAGSLRGSITGGAGDDELHLGGSVVGDIETLGGADVLEIDGSYNGKASLGEGNDEIILTANATLSEIAVIDAGDGIADRLVLNGAVYASADQIRGTEEITKTGTGTAILIGAFDASSGLEVEEGTLRLAGGTANRITGDALVLEGAAYVVDGIHDGDVLTRGTLGGIGTIGSAGLGLVQNAGIVSPGMGSIGILSIDGDYQQWAEGRLDIQLGAPGNNDLLWVSGHASLDGTVNFIPQALTDTAAYTFMQYGSHSGEFATVAENGGAVSGIFYGYSVSYLDDRAIVNVVKTGSGGPGGGSGGCTPDNPGDGANVICTAPASTSYSFEADTLDVDIVDLIELDLDSPFVTVDGANNVVTIEADAGILNSGSSGALALYGSDPTLVNHGRIDGPADEQALVNFAPAGGTQGILVNTGTIGHAGALLAMTAYPDAEGATAGSIAIYNSGSIGGAIDVDGATSAHILNGFNSSGVQSDGVSRIDGAITTTSGDDIIANSGIIAGAVRTGEGDDEVHNYEDGIFTDYVDLGAGDDLFEQRGDGRVGSIFAGSGDDLIDLHGKVGGDVMLGDDDDRLVIRNAVDFTAASSLVSGQDGSDTLEFFANNGSWDSARFTAFERVEKTGGGATVLTGDWTLANGLAAKSGLLTLATGATVRGAADVASLAEYRVNGTQLGDVAVAAGGILSGSGSIGSAGTASNVANRGTVSPGTAGSGSEIATLRIDGNYTQSSEGRLWIDLGAPGQSDLLSITGTAALAGSVQFNPIDVGALGSYTFLSAAGGVTGTFGTLNPDVQQARGNFFSYALDYSDSKQVKVVLTRTAGGGGDDPIFDVLDNLSGNQQAVYDAFTSPGAFSQDLAQVRGSVNLIDADKVADALDSFSGEVHAAVGGALAGNSSAFAEAVSGVSIERGRRLWARGYGNWSKTSGARGAHHVDIDRRGIAGGMDFPVGGSASVGLMAGFGSSDIEIDGIDSRAETRGVEIGAYFDADAGGLFLRGQVSRGWHDVETRRTIITGDTTTREAVSDGKARGWQARLDVSAPTAIGTIRAVPSASIAYVAVHRRGLTETGAGDAGLEVGGRNYRQLTLRAGGELLFGSSDLVPFLGARLVHDVLRSESRSVNAMIGGGGDFAVGAASGGRTGVEGGAGIRGRVGPAEIALGYRIEGRKGLFQQKLDAGVTLRW